MDFKRKKKRGQNQRFRRTWLSEDGYCIIWRKEVCGVRVPARFQACVRVVVPNYGGKQGEPQVWDFVNRQRRLFKTMKAAVETCEIHKRLWSKACQATGLRGLLDLFGTLPPVVPLWARKKLPRKVHELLMNPRPVR